MKTISLQNLSKENFFVLNDYVKDVFLRKRYIDGQRICVYCGEEKIYELKDGNRYKCKSCRLKFRDWTNTSLSKCRLSELEVYKLVWCFTLGINALLASRKLNISYQTAFEFYSLIRVCLINKNITLSKIGQKENANFIYYFKEESGVFFIDEKMSNYILSGKDSYFFSINSNYKITKFVNLENTDSENLLLFLSSFLLRYRGVTCKNQPEYLAELVWRFNNRHVSLFKRSDYLLSLLLS